ncbi:GlsB/YeaQ/YmgE family stress response membrane protein [Streptomyces sp. Ru71]|uniref:GlsB/YeaQ/YmgE family stress response membrane protein n=1 Tax=Streptomyces sp. Ru71 TaxID=2080746 RepID=UPI000CDD988F|nr:GlsB/YeaQ/YmgE family stress response membrane protein [Streptomyces sp. Ru71]POX47241.1 GlsB/YeaQ/YmgE family stress response membrane protein [Streptomyces sp. Ru71]
MGWLWAIIVGFVLGLIAKAIIPGKQHSPLWLTTIFGMLGAIVGNAVARAAGVEATSGIDWWRHLFQLIAAIIIVAVGDMAYMALWGNKKMRQRA